MKNLMKLSAIAACAFALSACMMGHAPKDERIIKYAYCTGPDGKVVADPAKAFEAGTPLRCFNFIAK